MACIAPCVLAEATAKTNGYTLGNSRDEAPLLLWGSHLPSKRSLNNGADAIANLNSHVAKGRPAHSVAGHVGEGFRRFLLSGLDVRQFHPLFIKGQLVAIADIEEVSLHQR